jgi:nucleoside-diphosphate-sugar epimerase
MRIIENKDGCASGGIFNIGNPENDLSVKELAEKLIALVMEYPAYRAKAEACRLVETTSDTYYGKGYQDMLTRVPSIRNAEERLGWAPKTGIDEALRKTLDFYLIEQKEKIEHLL